MLGKAILLVFLSVSAFNFTQGQTNDTTISAEKVYLKIQGQSGGMVIGRVQNPDQDNNAVKIKFDAIQEVNSAGVAVGASGRSKHSFNNFAQLDFTFSSLEDTTYKNLTAKTVSFKASISSVNANLTVQTFIITEAGNITIDGESTVVEKGTVKFNINIEGWGFCDASRNCRKGNQDEIGEYIDLTISIKGKGTPSKKAGNNKRSEGEEFDLGGDASVALSKKIHKEFEILKPELKKEVLTDRWTDMLRILDEILNTDQESDIEDDDVNKDGDMAILTVLKAVEVQIQYKTKKEADLISLVNVKNPVLTTKASSPPRAVILQNEDGTVNSCYVVGDKLEFRVGKDIKELLQFLLMIYYVFDMNYPKCYQLLGFLQVALFRDSAPFFRCSRFSKFEKEYVDKRDSANV